MLNGCEAVALGAWEAGAHAITSYPGSPVTSVMEAAQRLGDMTVRWAANEKVALEIAAGVAYSGARALTVLKHVGLNVAADALFNLAYTGVRGGLVIVVGDDPGATCSQNEQDSRLLAYAAGLPILEPADCQDALLFTKLAFSMSAKYDVPVLVRMTTQLCYGAQRVVTSERNAHSVEGGFAEPIEKYLLLPAFVPNRHRALLTAMDKIAHGPEIASLNEELWPEQREERYELGVICAGATFAAVREHFEGAVPMLRVGCANPLSEQRIRRFAARCERLVVTEECSTFLADRVRALGIRVESYGEQSAVGAFRVASLASVGLELEPALVEAEAAAARAPRSPFPIPVIADMAPPPGQLDRAAPSRPPGFCAGCSHVGIFDVLRERKLYVVGDIGCYTLGGAKPFGALHANLCMGASVGILQGYLLAQPERERDVVAVIGDSTFFHAGIPALITAITQGHRGTLLILDNAGTAMTGFQQTCINLDETRWRDLLRTLGVKRFDVIPALDIDAINGALDGLIGGDDFAVIVLKGDCVQSRPRKGPTNFRYTVIDDACTGCGQCVERTNCPSLTPIRLENGEPKVVISNECIGCGLCSQTCPTNAILPRTVRTGWDALDKPLARLPWQRVIRFIHERPALRRFAYRFEREQR